MLDGALRNAERNPRDAEREEADRRQLIQHRGVDRTSGVWPTSDLVDRQRAVFGYQDVLDHDVLAAGAGKADDLPGVDDRVVLGRKQEDARACAAALLVVGDAADQVPRRGIDTA